MFEIQNHDATLSHINQRIQRHGDKRVLAVDLSLMIQGPNTLLEGIHPDLRPALYRAPTTGDQGDFVNDQQAKENGIDDGLVARRLACVGTFPITHTFEGYEVTVRGPLKRSKAIKLIDVKLSKLVVKALDGGTVEIEFKASSEVEPKELATLGDLLLLSDIRLTLTPPDSDRAGSDEEEGEDEDEEAEGDDESDNDDDGGDLLDHQDREAAHAHAA